MCSGVTSHVKPSTHLDVLRALHVAHCRDEHGQETAVYTVGSKMEDKIGYAAVVPNRVFKRRLPKEASIFSAELCAILAAVALLLNVDQHRFVFYVDSRSALQAVTNRFSGHPVVRQIHTWMEILMKRSKHIRFCWVPSHVGLAGNDEADRLAKESAACNRVYLRTLPARDYYSEFWKRLYNAWQNQWKQRENNKVRVIKDNARAWGTSYQTSRHKETVIARLRIGHTRLTHRYLMEDGDT